MKHYHFICGNEWTMPTLNPKFTYRLDLTPIFDLVKNEEPVLVDFIDIAHNDMFTFETTTKRFKRADTNYPGILIDGLVNVNNLRYRMIDGRHRIIKMKMAGETQSLFYILHFTEIIPHLPTEPTNLLADTIVENNKYLKDAIIRI